MAKSVKKGKSGSKIEAKIEDSKKKRLVGMAYRIIRKG